MNRWLTIDEIIRRICDEFCLSETAVLGKSRLENVVLIRHSAMYLCRELLRSSFREIGLKFGGRDHATVIHAYCKIKERMSDDEIFKARINTIHYDLQREFNGEPKKGDSNEGDL